MQVSHPVSQTDDYDDYDDDDDDDEDEDKDENEEKDTQPSFYLRSLWPVPGKGQAVAAVAATAAVLEFGCAIAESLEGGPFALLLGYNTN
ncbi:hypothetical protein M0802_007617 [Mischocyttarus mexicanus]|nr:hypothetical protein M0802_007617 [Mischocyttarus mexicanus]